MEATMKLSNIILSRRIHSPLLSRIHLTHLHPVIHQPQCPKHSSNPLIHTPIMLPRTFSRFTSSIQPPVSNPLIFFFFSLSLSCTHLNLHDTIINQHDGPVESEKDDHSVVNWNRAAHEGRVYFLAGKNRVATVVLLGWLGAEPRHLRRYAELYNSQGIHAVTFVVPVSEVLCFDLGRRVERRIKKLADELASWVSDETGADRCLIFHTFSNTGWLVYGSILDHWKDRPELNHKIKGCIVDSGGDPELNPKVWATGFCAAILKKRSSLTKPSVEGLGAYESEIEGHMGKVQRKESDLLESTVVYVLETLFCMLLNLPDVNKRLMKIIVLLSEKPPTCPQLYLYSTADKVIPYRSVESFMQIQRDKGMDVDSFNFQSSPHVDHFRTFSDLYTSVLHKFLKKCVLDPQK